MKHSLFTKLMSLFLAFALLVPCFPQAYAEESTDPTEAAVLSETTIPTEETEITEVTDATEAPETTEAPEVTESTGETIPPSETTVPTQETISVEETVPTVETVPTEETVPAEETEPTEETEPAEPVFLPLGMPEGYVLSEENAEDRQDMIDHNVLDTLSTMSPGVDYVQNEILVLAESEEEAQLIAEAYCGDLLSFYDGLAVIYLKEATVAEAVEASLNEEFNLPVASPNYTVFVEPMLTTPVSTYASEVPSEMTWSDWVQDTMTNPDPALKTPTSNSYQYQHDVIDSYAAWGVTTGQSAITVAVIDTGVQSSHPDLNVTEYTVTDVGLTGDDNGHGTNVCGIIAATMDNGQGGAGIAPNINLTSYRVADSSGSMSNNSLYYAIRQAARNGADVINMSLGSYGYSSVVQSAIDYAAEDYDVTIVVSMGNDGTNIMCYPAACDNVIAVAATDRSNRRAFFSNYGAWCDISAPGVDMYSTYPGSSYAWMSGTSQAAPVVTGAIALYMSHVGYNPSPAYVEKVLKASATKCADKGMGAGIVNIANMLDDKPDAPTFRLEYDGSVIYNYGEYDGTQVPCETSLHFAVYGRDESWYVLYTLNGKTPSVKNGQIVNGIVCDWNGIDLSPYAGTTVTVKAMQVSGMGLPGKVMTKKIKVGESEQITGITISGPKTIVAGKSGQFTATVNPVDTADQSVSWSIVSRSSSLSSAKISQKGVLTTPKNASGSITIRATSLVRSSKYTNYTVQVKIINPVAKVTLSQTTGSLYIGQTLKLSPTMTDKNGTTVTTAGSLWTSSNKQVAAVDSSGNVTAIGKGKATITCKALDGSNKTAKCTITVKQQVTGITITGNYAVAPGGSATLKAQITPSSANTKSVIWSLVSAPAGVSISTSGVVKIPSYVTSGTVQVKATAKDGQGAYDTHSLTIQQKITALYLQPRSSYNGYASGFAYKSGKLSTVNLFSVDLNENSAQDNYCALRPSFTGPSSAIFQWSSSNPAVASVSTNGYVTAHKAGTAKITCTALDSSKKTASVTVKVTNPVSYMEIKTSAAQMTNNTPYIGIGKSVTNQVVFGDTYGTPANKKVTWDYEIYQYNTSGSYVSEWTSTFKNNKLVTVSSSGKVTVSKSAINYWGNISGEFVLRLYAYATDGTGAYAYKDFLLIPPATKIEMIEGKKYSLSRNSNYIICFASDQWHSFMNEYQSGFVVTSSNPKVCGVGDWYYREDLAVRPCEHYYSNSMNCYDLYLVTGQKGTAKITIKATDGSNKSCSFTVKVS